MPIDILIGYTTFLVALISWGVFETQGRYSLFGNGTRAIRMFQFLAECASVCISIRTAVLAWQAQDIRNFSVQAVLGMVAGAFAYRIYTRLNEAE
jgi:hypothetical protein